MAGTAKIAVYKSRKKQVEGEAGLGLAEMFMVLVKPESGWTSGTTH